MSSNFNLVDTKSWSLNGKCFILVSNTLLHKPFEHKIKSIRGKQFFDSFQNISYNHEDDSIYHYNIVLGDFNCILDKKIDRYPNRRTDDIGKIELQNLITRYDKHFTT
jgi:hypothetical protein